MLSSRYAKNKGTPPYASFYNHPNSAHTDIQHV